VQWLAYRLVVFRPYGDDRVFDSAPKSCLFFLVAAGHEMVSSLSSSVPSTRARDAHLAICAKLIQALASRLLIHVEYHAASSYCLSGC